MMQTLVSVGKYVNKLHSRQFFKGSEAKLWEIVLRQDSIEKGFGKASEEVFI